ncbi:histone deacetylase 8 [Olea europaea var. sylvestris]|uniref:histone deacetylase 8 n=1 Tax=Olea europaea var. sylvestris TaxID=158386 RepID=UPI000C1D5AD4|nr:histone deacetylase 8 [Olea europaea var. sylvestris]
MPKGKGKLSMIILIENGYLISNAPPQADGDVVTAQSDQSKVSDLQLLAGHHYLRGTLAHDNRPRQPITGEFCDLTSELDPVADLIFINIACSHFHTQDYINELVEADRKGGKFICTGTFLNPGSWDAALLAAGTTLSAMQYILDGCGKIAYALVRPPGHHAQPTQADGYCFLNNAGLAVQLGLNSRFKKVSVIDIDVHYGNGTAEGFYCSDRVLTISLHMNHGSWGPSHPQKGSIDELGEGDGFGYNLNIPLPNGTGDRGYAYAMAKLVVPSVEKFERDMIVLVVGQDSSAFDPNGRQCLTMEGYRKIGRKVREMADKYCDGCILIVQEGGYHVTYSAYCLHATLEGVLNNPDPLVSDPIAYYPEDEAFTTEVVESIKRYQMDKVPFLK